ncbi:hypothetical protein DSM100238_1485 [Bifidobacterium apri]|uniref:Uncharacterized protein n=1 Tax=Bifidobacterium apri TaxID=1769423 RepID=A0A6A2VDJ4_9BIFI|nr:hypothetical protein DSM100238_1485 [Bifidobacterium apri]
MHTDSRGYRPKCVSGGGSVGGAVVFGWGGVVGQMCVRQRSESGITHHTQPSTDAQRHLTVGRNRTTTFCRRSHTTQRRQKPDPPPTLTSHSLATVTKTLSPQDQDFLDYVFYKVS